MESDSSENDKRLANKSRYEEYDSKPIKPLDPKLFNKKLSEYPELSLQEIEEIKRKTAQRTRAKTTEQPKVMQQKLHGKIPMRQLSFNSSNSSPKINQSPRPSAAITAEPVKIRKRSKTQDDVRVNRAIKTASVLTQNGVISPSVNVKSKIKYNPDRYSPKINKTSVQPRVDSRRIQPQNNSQSPKKDVKNNIFLKNIGKKSLLISNLSDDEDILEDQSSKFNSPIKSKANTQIQDKTPGKLNEKKEQTNAGAKLLPDESVSNKLSIKEQLHHMEIQNKIQKQRQEMRLQRERNLIEFKNLSKSHNNDPIKTSKDEVTVVSKNLTCKIFNKII